MHRPLLVRLLIASAFLLLSASIGWAGYRDYALRRAPNQTLLVGTWTFSEKVTIDALGRRSTDLLVPLDTFTFSPDESVRKTYEVGSRIYTGTYVIRADNTLDLEYTYNPAGKGIAREQTAFRLDHDRLILIKKYSDQTEEMVFVRSSEPTPEMQRSTE